MNEITSMLIDTISRSHPIVPILVSLACVAGLLGFFGLWLWQRWLHHEVRRKCDELRNTLDQSRTDLSKGKEQDEKTIRRLKLQVSQTRNQASEDLQKLRGELSATRTVLERYRVRLNDAMPAFERVSKHNDDLLKQNEESTARCNRLQAEVSALLQRFDDLQKIDADVWTAPAIDAGKPPPFVGRERRKTRFVTFLNLKGGVGKTTIVANLAAAFATGVLGEKKRVLVVDLDYQGTLSNRCVDRTTLADRRTARRTADKLIEANAEIASPEAFDRLLVPMSGAGNMGFAIIADEHLDHVDFRKQAVFAVESSEVRFEHRRLFHQRHVFDQFDFVFFDCPPRLTTSSINAMTCSDWIVIPTGPDPNDIEAVPRTLRWFDKLRTQAAIDFHAQVAGIVINNTYHSGTIDNLTKQECNALQQLRQSIKQFLPTDAAILRHVVKDDNAIARSAESVPYGTTAKGHELFGDVARELYERIKN